MIDTYMAALGFQKVENEGRFSNGQYVVWDVISSHRLKTLCEFFCFCHIIFMR